MATTSDERFEVGRWQRSLLPGGLFVESGTRRSLRDWLVDVALFVFAVGLGAVVLFDTWSKHSTATAIADIVFGTLACLSLWWRRRAPTAVGLFCTVLSAFFALPAGAGLVAIFNAAIRSTPRGLVAVVVCGVCGPAVYAALYAGGGGYSWSDLIIGALLTAVAVGWGLFVRSRRSLIISLRERADRLQAEQRLHAERAREAERSRIAREMHDVLAHRLSLLSVHAGALEYRPDALPPRSPRPRASSARPPTRLGRAASDHRHRARRRRDRGPRIAAAHTRPAPGAGRRISRGRDARELAGSTCTTARTSPRRSAAPRTGSSRRASPTRASTHPVRAVEVTISRPVGRAAGGAGRQPAPPVGVRGHRADPSPAPAPG